MFSEQEQRTIDKAIEIIESKARKNALTFNYRSELCKFLQMKLAHHRREVFSVIYLNVHNEMLNYEEVFLGTVSHASVYPREIAKKALDCGAESVILAHNHPSGSLQVSASDECVTDKIQSALRTLDIGVQDHIIVSHRGTTSFVDLNLL
tara:strand:- start:69 stop:518 length:450 start_codon:yes stop_codon:yes gene_type:complete